MDLELGGAGRHNASVTAESGKRMRRADAPKDGVVGVVLVRWRRTEDGL